MNPRRPYPVIFLCRPSSVASSKLASTFMISFLVKKTLSSNTVNSPRGTVRSISRIRNMVSLLLLPTIYIRSLVSYNVYLPITNLEVFLCLDPDVVSIPPPRVCSIASLFILVLFLFCFALRYYVSKLINFK
ncbi:hypothetical protein SCEN_N00220 [Saccharomyces cerevisiae]|uniref:Putative uncharacterized protein YNL324W n=1 Tax=Saccharomyces cerevisiae (strain ATCC 204508 / S288c) TaxID=559292 RepID=YN64_YEAST|nr:RecName: Full=Putative uncharacterized protein YNL324W [Saccharomyces cerevisiae S288C]AAT93344.1 YNL324W [Saccharomyces cerevisiae]KZV08301.1 hypothetical protein WN66_05210 [Saccharomyces cerevisiae]QHB11071.1 hypothetical protein SCEN_N00220 [Saccharomyces cerevisiae]CAA96257.1 unnamed protein product [Saccharomyces cerevisiae]